MIRNPIFYHKICMKISKKYASYNSDPDSNININLMRKLMLSAVIQMISKVKELQNIFTKILRVVKDYHYLHKNRKYQFSN